MRGIGEIDFYLAIAGMSPAIFNALTFRLAMKFFVARQLFFFKPATAPFDPHLKTLGHESNQI